MNELITAPIVDTPTIAPVSLSPINAKLLAIKQWRASIVDRYYETAAKEKLQPGERVIKSSQGIDRLYVAPTCYSPNWPTRPMALSQSRQYKRGAKAQVGNPSPRQWRKIKRLYKATAKSAATMPVTS